MRYFHYGNNSFFQHSTETLTQVFPQLKLESLCLLSFNTAWLVKKTPTPCTKLCNCGDFLFKKKYCLWGRQPTPPGSTGPTVLRSCEEHATGDDWGLGHLETLIWETFSFFMDISSRKALFIAWRACLYRNSLWQGFSISNIVTTKHTCCMFRRKMALLSTCWNRGNVFWVIKLKHSLQATRKISPSLNLWVPYNENTLRLSFHSDSWSLNHFNT